MAVNFEDTVFGFDLNYLHQTTDYNLVHSRIDKQRMAVLKAKKKTICTDSLIRKYHEKQQLLEEMEKDFLASNEECKQIRIEYQNSLDKCSRLEMERNNLQTLNHELENQLRIAKNQQEGTLAHSNQLQMLIKDYKTRIEAQNIEKQLEKDNMHENEKNIVNLTKDKYVLMKHINVILDVALKNNNLSSKDKKLLLKYRKVYRCNESSKEPEYSGDETDTLESYDCNLNTTFSKDESSLNQSGTPVLKVDDIDRDSNGSNNEIGSTDTGRGSSLTFSDSDKCFHSPEYFSDHSPHSVILNSKADKTFANKATSPINKRTNNAALSPIKEFLIPGAFEKQTITTSPIQFDGKDILFENNPGRECVDLCDDGNSNDCEIESILSSMRFKQNLITPIPCTPSRSRARMQSISEHSEHTCPEAAKIREENKSLQTSVANLAKEVMSIKSMLKLHSMTEDSGTSQPNPVDSNLCTQRKYENKSARLLIANEEAVVDPHCDTESQFSIASLETLVNEFPSADDDVFLDQSTENDGQNIEISNLSVVNNIVAINASQNLLFEEDEGSKRIGEERGETAEVANSGNNFNTSIQNTFNTFGKKNMRKLTRLQRLRVKMLPKGKIPMARTLPQRKMRMKPKQIKMTKKKPCRTDSSATLNDKEVYAKAVKVMAELKCKNIQRRMVIRQANIGDTCDVDVNSNKKCSSKASNNSFGNDSTTKEHHNLELDNRNLDNINVSPQVSTVNTRSRSKHFDTKSVVSNGQKGDTNEVNSNEIGNRNKNVISNDFTTQVPQVKRKYLRSSYSERETENKVDSVHEVDNKATSENCVSEEKIVKKISLKRPSCDEPEIENKRVLRSSSAHLSKSSNSQGLVYDTKQWEKSECSEQKSTDARSRIANYSDLDLFTDEPSVYSKKAHDVQETGNSKTVTPQESILCVMLEKYGVTTVRNCNKKIPENVINCTNKQIQDGIAKIIEMPQNETKAAMNSLVESLRKCRLNDLLMGLMQYLKDPVRKAELFSKIYTASAPPMTKSEQVLLYILSNLQGTWPGVDFIGCVLDNMEYTLFKLNRTPEFETIESMSHFYAVLCRYMKNKSRLRLFVLDAMYCIQYKAVPLIKQCMEVWMHILPLAHLGIAKSPLVMCVVYLLHFFKCEDRFNRVTEIRNILSKKYFYKLSDWNETKILEMFRSSIKELKGDTIEKKMLRLALIVLAKRQGPQWCQKNIIKNLFQPMIEDENSPEIVKVFCLSMLGPLTKPYPGEMRVHWEIVMNQLVDLLNSSLSPREQEAVVTSLIYMSKHDHNRVARVLLSWSPKQISPELEAILKGYVREKPLKIWKQHLSRLN